MLNRLTIQYFGQNQGKWSESGSYGSVWVDTSPESIPYGLGGLLYASKTPKPLKNPKILGVQEIRESGKFSYTLYSCGVALMDQITLVDFRLSKVSTEQALRVWLSRSGRSGFWPNCQDRTASDQRPKGQ